MHHRPVPMVQRDISGTANTYSCTFRLAEQKVQCSSSVGVVTGPRAGNQEIAVRLPSGSSSFSIPHRTVSAVSHPAYCPVGKGCTFPRLKRSGLEADHLSVSSAEFNNDWMFTSIKKLYGVTSGLILCYLYRTTCSHCVNQQMQPTKCNNVQTIQYNSWPVSNCYMFRHRSAILSGSTRTKTYKCNTLIQV